tara:strand:- start:81 stop:254 length:174 start_codon:yes stop_codon:yes gene_type:complete
MQCRIEETDPIDIRDPLFAENFCHIDMLEVRKSTYGGVRMAGIFGDARVAKFDAKGN